MSERKHEQRIDEIAGVDQSDVEEGLRHDPDDAMERAGKSHHTKRELGLPPDSDADPEEPLVADSGSEEPRE